MNERPVDKFLREYNQIFKENNDLYRGAAKALGLSDTAFWILYTLQDSHGMATQREVCSMLYEPKQTINSALKKLEAEGSIEQVQGKDRRSKLVKLTEPGIRLAAKTADVVMDAEYRAFDNMPESEREQLLHLFSVYTKNLKKEMETSGLISQKKKERDSKKK